MGKLEDALIDSFDTMTLDEARDTLRLVEEAMSLSGAAHDALRQLCLKGPVWDGDLCSKSGRCELLSINAAAKVIVKGEQGFQAANIKAGGCGSLSH